MNERQTVGKPVQEGHRAAGRGAWRLRLAAALAAWLLAARAVAAASATMPLDGSWRILFDRDNQGREGQWHLDSRFLAQPGQREIQVPCCWEEVEKNYEGVAYYRREFTPPAEWAGRVVRLQFDAVNFAAEVWLNDQAIGFHEGGFGPFEFRVDPVLKPGEPNTLIVRVAGPILLEDKRIDGVGKMETPQWRGAITGGIWQPVRLVATGEAYVDDVFVEPRLADDAARFRVKVRHCGLESAAVELAVAVRSANQPIRTVAEMRRQVSLHPGVNRSVWTLAIPDAQHWSPDHPHLYQAEVMIRRGGEVLDRWTARFGMREFTVRDGRFYLNGKPLYLKATFFEGLYPVKLAYPDSREMAAREIRLAKQAGFNMIRPWRKPPPPMWLDLADELGVLTVGSLAVECMGFPLESARLPGWVENEVRQSVLRDRNRACVVQWELFNELTRPVLSQLRHRMAMLARQLDPTRMILDESGGWAEGANLYLPYQYEPIKFNDIHHYPGPQINREVYDAILWVGRKSHEELRAMGITSRLPGRNVKKGIMSYISELGYGSLPDLVDNNERFARAGNPIVPPTAYHRRLAEGHRRALRESGFDAVYPDLRRFCLDQQRQHGEANKRMIEAARCNPAVAGYCVHALVAGDWIIGAGLLDMWRNPKGYAYEGTKEATQPRILCIRSFPRNVYAERGCRIEVTGVNEAAPVDGELAVRLVGPDGAAAYQRRTAVSLPTGIRRLLSETIDTRGLSGTWEIRAALTSKDGAAIENTYAIDVFSRSQLEPPPAAVAVLDPKNVLKPFLEQAGVPAKEFGGDIDASLPVLVAYTPSGKPSEQQRRRFARLEAFVRRGGTAVLLDGLGVHWGQRFAGSARQFVSPVLPFRFRPVSAIGTWTGIPQLVKRHPIFEGLPSNCMMGPLYENVWSPVAMCDLPGEPIVAAIGFDWFPDGDRMRRHYYGPGDVWWASVLAVVPHGEGRFVVSQLRLLRNLGRDPVADKLLLNMIRFAAQAGEPG